MRPVREAQLIGRTSNLTAQVICKSGTDEQLTGRLLNDYSIGNRARHANFW